MELSPRDVLLLRIAFVEEGTSSAFSEVDGEAGTWVSGCKRVWCLFLNTLQVYLLGQASSL